MMEYSEMDDLTLISIAIDAQHTGDTLPQGLLDVLRERDLHDVLGV